MLTPQLRWQFYHWLVLSCTFCTINSQYTNQLQGIFNHLQFLNNYCLFTVKKVYNSWWYFNSFLFQVQMCHMPHFGRSVADPGFFWTGRQLPKQKLYENDRTWTPGGHVSLAPPSPLCIRQCRCLCVELHCSLQIKNNSKASETQHRESLP